MIDVAKLVRVQEESYARADGALRDSWPQESAMDADELRSFLDERRYCVLATTTARGHAQARPVAFAVVEGTFWFATVAGGRLRNLRRTPWVSVVVSDGEGDRHRAVVADGQVTIAEEPSDELRDTWETRFGSHAEWASAWFQLEPERLFSHVARR